MDYFGLGDRREREPIVWEDERTGLLCRISSLYAGVGITIDHPWFGKGDCPLKGIKSYGIVRYPSECQGKWWFYFPMGKEDYEYIKKRCMILAALLEVEGTELAQEIASLPPSPKNNVKDEGEGDDGEDDYEDSLLLEKIASTFKDYGEPRIDVRLVREYLAACADEH